MSLPHHRLHAEVSVTEHILWISKLPEILGELSMCEQCVPTRLSFFFFSAHAREPGNEARVNSKSMPLGVYVDFSLDSLKDTRLLATIL